MTIFSKYEYEIKIPKGVKTEWFDNKVRFIGTKNDLYDFLGEFRKLKEYKDGSLVKLDSLTLKVSEHITEDRNKKHWIELHDHAWVIMSSKFYDVWAGYDANPFDFNDCGYTIENPFDIGIEITDLPLSNNLIFDSNHIKIYKSGWNELYLLVEGTELFDFLEDILTEKGKISIEYHQQSNINSLNRYRIFIDVNQESNLIELLKSIDSNKIKEIWKLNNK